MVLTLCNGLSLTGFKKNVVLTHGSVIVVFGFRIAFKIFSHISFVAKKNDSPKVGLEPTTPRLRVSCSTDLASRVEIHVHVPHGCCL